MKYLVMLLLSGFAMFANAQLQKSRTLTVSIPDKASVNYTILIKEEDPDPNIMCRFLNTKPEIRSCTVKANKVEIITTPEIGSDIIIDVIKGTGFTKTYDQYYIEKRERDQAKTGTAQPAETKQGRL